MCGIRGLRVNEGPIFSVIASRQERGSFVYKQRQTGEAKTKAYIFVYKIFTNSFLKSNMAIAM